ncbi:hypothetical protein [Spirosoma pulveris]
MTRVQIGDFIAVRLEQRAGKEGTFWVPLVVKPTQQTPPGEIYKAFSGPVKRPSDKPFGFVDDVFVPPFLLKGAANRAIISGQAFCSFDKLKGKYGWKAISGVIINGSAE